MIARQSTATTFMIGPVLDADGVAVTDCVVGDFKLSKGGGAPAALNGSSTLTHRHTGFYSLAAAAGDFDTVGLAQFTIDDTVNSCAPVCFNVVEEAVFDSLFAASAAGYQVPIWSSASATVNLSGTTVKTATDVATDTATLLSRLTSGRASNLDNLDVAISVIQSQITALNNLSAKANWFGALLLEIPDSGTRDYLFELVVRDDEDKLVNLDGLPTIALVNAAGTDRSSLITTAIANPATGRYTLTITVGTSTVNESLKLTASGTVSGEARYAVIAPQVVDYDSATQINTILTRIGTPAVSVSDDIAALNDLDSTAVQAAAAAALTAYGAATGSEVSDVPGDTVTLLGSGTEVYGHSIIESIKRIEVVSGAATLSGAGTGTEVMTSSDSSKTATFTVDGSGNVSAVVWS